MGFQVFVYLFCWVLAIRGVVSAKEAAAGEECRVMRCSRHGPEIRFPFWLKDHHPEHCGYPGFQLSCHGGKTLLDHHPEHCGYLFNTSLQGIQLLLSNEVSVRWINYKLQEMELEDQFANMKLVSTSTLSPSTIASSSFITTFPSSITEMYSDNYTFFSCSSIAESDRYLFPQELISLSGEAFPIYNVYSYQSISDTYLTSCTKVFDVFPSFRYIYGRYIGNWSTPNCGKCETKGEYCKLRKNTTSSKIETADQSTICLSRGKDSFKPIVGIIPGATLIVLVLVVLLYFIIRSYRRKKYDELKIEMFLTDYKAMKPTRYSYADIKKITSQFSDKLGQGGYGSVYKGQITNDIIVAVKVLNSDPKANGEDFINEVGTIGQIYHVNVVRLVGYCADGCNRALVYEFQPNNSLEKFTYGGKKHQNNFLGWDKMQEIALGIARGIEYLHLGCAQQILHFDIKPHNILLDQKFNPKISDFGLAKLCSKDQSIVSMTMARGTIGYIAPEVYSRNFGKVSSKSDVYSFGMLLLEMVGARDNKSVENTSETYFPEWIFHRLEEGGEVTIQIEKEEDSNIAKKLTIVGLWCIGWHPVDRPSMKHVIHMLEGQGCPAMPPNPFKSSNVRSFTNDLEVISESE